MKIAAVLPPALLRWAPACFRGGGGILAISLSMVILLPNLLMAQVITVQTGERSLTQKPGQPNSSDGYSGKTVVSEEMAFEMLRVRQDNAPRVGEAAPPFRLYSLDRKREVELKELIQEKRVVLLFSSWGCDVFRESVGGLNLLYLQFRDKVDFVMIYTREIHPLDGFSGGLGRVEDPKTDTERRTVATRCRKQLRLPFEVLVDGVDDSVATRWAGMPVRAFVIDRSGTVIYAGAQGPWGFRPYEGFEHGDGSRLERDFEFNWDSLESFLNQRYGS